jgi:cyclopropane fatty-acyl-phospholipid synthase-like methyltransferase
MPGWTRAQLRHLVRLFRYDRHPAATVYESLGSDVFGAFEPGWLNLGYWDGPGDDQEAALAPRRMVERVCAGLAPGGRVLDVGNGLAAQDVVIRELLRPDRLVAVNVSHFQLREGRSRLAEARADAVTADATCLPIASGVMSTVVSIEAAFHFSSRTAFFAEAHRVLEAGGMIALSDIVVRRRPRGAFELIAGVWTMRFWGLRRTAVATADEVADQLAAAGFADVDVRRCGDVVIDPALRVLSRRFQANSTAPRLHRWGARAMVAQWGYLRRSGVLDYVLISARATARS